MTDPRSPTRPARLRTRGADVVLVTVRELRLLLGLLLVLFVTSETWRYVGRLGPARLLLVVTVVVGGALGVATVGLRRSLPTSLDRSTTRRSTARVATEVVGFGAALFAGFTAFGALTVDEQLVEEWTSAPADVLFGLHGAPVVVTRALVQVAAFLGALGALAFSVEAVVDPAARQTLLHDLLGEHPEAT
ncbi:hypothetical protein ACI797_11825 [Geodermatophilus sp. SYSU D00691]